MATEVHQGIARANAVLAAIVSAPAQTMKASDIARAVNLGASTTGRLLGSLEELGYVRKNHSTAAYSIGWRFVEIASRGMNQIALHREGRPLAQELAQNTGFSANVGMLDGDSVVYLCHFEGAKARKSHTMSGMHQPLYASALGKCLLLDETTEEISARFSGHLERYTRYTDATVNDLLEDLSASRERGYCIEDQELALGRYGIAAPVRGSEGNIVGGISLAGRKSLFFEEDVHALADLTLETADRISVALGLISAI